ncbi:MAG: NAD(P)-dependent oxidoreductase [bacterium]|nr:NAD(P)-dependent oxidoreductase [bacterium]
MRRVIITGGDGFVGSNTVNYFLKQGVEVVALDLNRLPHNLKEHPLLHYICLDISAVMESLVELPKLEYDSWIHFAWEGSAGTKRFDYALQMRNALDCVKCLKAAKEIGCKRFVGAGSIMEKEVDAVMQQQGSRPGMAYIYGMGKLIAHYMCKTIAADIGIDFLWPLITNTYGIGERSPRFINTTISKAVNGEPLEFTSGVQNYDFVYVDDMAKAFYLIEEKGIPFHEYVIGSGLARPLKEFIIEMLDTIEYKQSVSFGSQKYTGVNLALETFDTRNLLLDTGFLTEISFTEGIRRTKEWMEQNSNDNR